MSFNQITPQSQINDYLQREIEKRERKLVRNLNYIGLKCVTEARSSQAYLDDSGNLRSSIGYVITEDGSVISESSPEQIMQGAEGAESGIAYARSLASQFPTGYALILVAGMNYASYVADTGRDVLDSAELLAESLVAKMLKKISSKKQ